MNEKITEQTIGIINPGAMGISVAATMQNSGFDILWAAQGRSAQSKARAAQHNLIDVRTTAELFRRCTVLVSVCPPHAAEDVADQAIAAGFRGLFLDANAIAPQRAVRMGSKLQAAGISFVDGSIIGGPAWQAGKTWLYLSGAEAQTAVTYFAAGPLETEVLSSEIGHASALKACFAAYTKGRTALLSLILAGAQTLGVRPSLERQWERYWPGFAAETQQSVRGVTAKAWRFEGEMHEIASTFESVGLPGGFHAAAAEIYARMAEFKDAAKVPELDEVLTAVCSPLPSDLPASGPDA
jgi:3-hydroxyisobutyrate dehydrogenase-like beta-hydroxyacid dehydrogenase